MWSAPQEFSAFADADRNGFVLTGTGIAVVTTPGVHRRATADVLVSTGPAIEYLRADPQGRLTIDVPLGSGPLLPTAHVTVRTRR